MFLRVESDTFINLNNVYSYKLVEDHNSYKLMFWGSNGNIINSVFYLKNQPNQIELLTEVVTNLRELTLNPDISIYLPPRDFTNEPNEEVVEDNRHIEEVLDISPEDID